VLAYVPLISDRQKALAVPVSALNINGKDIMIWIKNTDGSFSPGWSA
jgi:hypothetical protein